jgi:hypothetical protein
MYEWKNNDSELPKELKKVGYNIEDVSRWIEQIKNK